MSKDVEIWFACLDRAIECERPNLAGVSPFSSKRVIALTQEFYEALRLRNEGAKAA